LGAGGVITYPRAKKTIEAFQSVPLEHIVLETDAPDMPLNGFQGETNSPLKLIDVAKCLAEIRNQPLESGSKRGPGYWQQQGRHPRLDVSRECEQLYKKAASHFGSSSALAVSRIVAETGRGRSTTETLLHHSRAGIAQRPRPGHICCKALFARQGIDSTLDLFKANILKRAKQSMARQFMCGQSG